jgi:hypothetical protein
MQIELLENKRGAYEIWTDGACIREIPRNLDEPMNQYKGRCNNEFEYYVEQMKTLQSKGPKKVRSITI